MKKINIIIFISLFIALSSCGYEPIFSKKNYDFSIKDIEIEGDKSLGIKISKNFEIFKNKQNNNVFNLVINSNLIKSVSSRDTKGNPKTFSIEIVSKIKIYNNNYNKIIKFKESTSYNNTSSKFELKKIENKLTENLIDKISGNIINSLQTF